jgi:hypothetical protein
MLFTMLFTAVLALSRWLVRTQLPLDGEARGGA